MSRTQKYQQWKRPLWIVLSLALTGCFASEEAAFPRVAVPVEGAQSGIAALTELARGGARSRPAAPLGVYVALVLAMHPSVAVHAALSGVETHAALSGERNRKDGAEEESFALLKEFGNVLQVNAIDMLNRASNRPEALNGYLASLIAMSERAQRHAEELEQKIDATEDRQSTERKVVSDFQRTLNQALREEDYAQAGTVQKDLATAQETLAATETELKRVRDLRSSFKKLLDTSSERVKAIETNRELLIAGIKVTEGPGLEHLGILNEEERASERTREDRLLNF